MTNILSQLHAGTDPFVGDRMQQFAQNRQINALNIQRDKEQNALNKIVGGALANDDFAGAKKLAFQGGDLNTGSKIGEMIAQNTAQERAQMRDALKTDAILRQQGISGEQRVMQLQQLGLDPESIAELDGIPTEAIPGILRTVEEFVERDAKVQDRDFRRAGEVEDREDTQAFNSSERVASQKFTAGQNAANRASMERRAALRGPLVQIGGAGGQPLADPNPPAFEGKTLFQHAPEAFGVVNSAEQIANNVVGQFTDNIPAPETADARAAFGTFKRQLIRAMSLSPRFPVAEQKRIEALVGNPDAFTAPAVAARNLVVLREDVESMNNSNRFIMNDPLSSQKEKAAARNALREGIELLNRIGEPAQDGAGELPEDVDAIMQKYGLE